MSFSPAHHEVNSSRTGCNIQPITCPKYRDFRYAAVLRVSYVTIYGKYRIWSFLAASGIFWKLAFGYCQLVEIVSCSE